MKELTDLALDAARGGNAAFADIRVVEQRDRRTFVERRALKGIESHESLGYCVRVLVDGAWGFASSTQLTRDGVQRTTYRALETARASSLAPKDVPAAMAPEPAHRDVQAGPCVEDPFEVPIAEQSEILLAACNAMMDARCVVSAFGLIQVHRTRRIIATSDGTFVDLTNTCASPFLRCTAVVGTESQSRQFQGGARQAGFEYIRQVDLPGHARQWAEEALMKCKAEDSPIGVMDLVLDPEHLALTLHESVGHPTESDRILCWEANYAGRSFMRQEDVGSLRYGSPLVNFSVDNALEGGVGSWFYDDDGVAMQAFPMVKDGVLVNLGTTRETATVLGWRRSNGCCRSEGFDRPPINRIPNLFMEPGADDAVAAADLIAGVDRGIFIEGQGSFSIDQMRRNFQFGGDLFWLIEGGRKTRPLKKVTYHAQTTAFWNACDGVAGRQSWRPHGIMNCGKGEPPQSMRMTHGASHARFRNVQVGDASR
jgi:TldD protein